MKKSTADSFQIGLLCLVTVILVVNALLFLRLQENQHEILRELRRSGSTAASGSASAPPSLEAGTEAPDFSLASLGGETVDLEDFEGHSVLLIFSSTTCPACDNAYPAIREFSGRDGAPPVLMISRGSEDENRRLVEEKSLEMPVLEWQDTVARAYRIPGTPYGVLVGGDGKVAKTGVVTRPFLDSLG